MGNKTLINLIFICCQIAFLFKLGEFLKRIGKLSNYLDYVATTDSSKKSIKQIVSSDVRS